MENDGSNEVKYEAQCSVCGWKTKADSLDSARFKLESHMAKVHKEEKVR